MSSKAEDKQVAVVTPMVKELGDKSLKDLEARAKLITARELEIYAKRTAGSKRAIMRARKVLPLGVPSSFQAYDPHPIVVRHSNGSRMVVCAKEKKKKQKKQKSTSHCGFQKDVDGNEYVDYDMGFGALFAGHMHPAVTEAEPFLFLRCSISVQISRFIVLFVCNLNTVRFMSRPRVRIVLHPTDRPPVSEKKKNSFLFSAFLPFCRT